MNYLIPTLAIWALPVLFAITLHEAAHGYVARKFGDPTAWLAGRVSLNPLRHIDPVGTVLVPALFLLAGSLMGGQPFLFGWAKPVPVNFSRLRRPKQDMLWVAAAGPGVNFLMALGWALIFKLALIMPETAYTAPLGQMADAGIQINIMLMVINLVPIPPLDGGRIAVSLLPLRSAISYSRIEPYGFFILIFLLYTHLLDFLLWPMLLMVRWLLSALIPF
jgi:Zn-dependent protease